MLFFISSFLLCYEWSVLPVFTAVRVIHFYCFVRIVLVILCSLLCVSDFHVWSMSLDYILSIFSWILVHLITLLYQVFLSFFFTELKWLRDILVFCFTYDVLKKTKRINFPQYFFKSINGMKVVWIRLFPVLLFHTKPNITSLGCKDCRYSLSELFLTKL